MSTDFRVTRGQVYWSCVPTGGPRIRVTAVGAHHAQVVDAKTKKRPRQILLTVLHPTPTTPSGDRRRTGYALVAGRVDSGPVIDHIQQIIAERPHLPVAAIAAQAEVPASTLKTLLADAGAGRRRPMGAETAHRLLVVRTAELPYEAGGFGGKSTEAAPAMRHLQGLMQTHPDVPLTAFARAAQMTPSTLAAALRDHEAGRPRTVKARAAERLLALGTTAPVPEGAARRRDVVDATVVVEHVRGLQCRYELASIAMIAQTAGVNSGTLMSVVTDFAAGQHRGTTPDLASKVLAVTRLPAPAFPRRPGVTDLGLVRRTRALCAAGWRLDSIARAGGTTVKSLGELLATGTATPSIRGAVLTAWSELAARCGPSAHARHRALSKRWDPPLAWDEETIDDPDTQPCGTRSANRSGDWVPQTLRIEIDFLARAGLSWTQSLQRLGLNSQRAHELLAQAHAETAPNTPCPQPPLPSHSVTSHTLAA
ncbi:hypothetical protein [Streptomyces sp. NPDC058268]|uniref:hypothetical protein n=1 Tax=Streptomyces sp. NPDC058268 TaxID=3346413 RepID=UPI0036E4AE4E